MQVEGLVEGRSLLFLYCIALVLRRGKLDYLRKLIVDYILLRLEGLEIRSGRRSPVEEGVDS